MWKPSHQCTVHFVSPFVSFMFIPWCLGRHMLVACCHGNPRELEQKPFLVDSCFINEVVKGISNYVIQTSWPSTDLPPSSWSKFSILSFKSFTALKVIKEYFKVERLLSFLEPRAMRVVTGCGCHWWIFLPRGLVVPAQSLSVNHILSPASSSSSPSSSSSSSYSAFTLWPDQQK